MTGLRIAYLCDMDPHDRNMYSGGMARMFEALGREVDDITVLPRDWGRAEPIRQAILASSVGVNMRLRWRAHYALRTVIAPRVEAALPGHDVLFSAYALHTLAGVRVPRGMISAFTSDAVQTVYRESEIGGAHEGRWLGRKLDRWVETREREILQGLDLGLWPSEWLKRLVDARYGLRADQSHLVPWGAGITPPPPPDPAWLRLDPKGPLHLLVIARDWWSKGGPVAAATARLLRDQGIDVRLTVIGCQVPEDDRDMHVTVHRSLDKCVPEQLALFEGALAQAHFLIMPSYESYGFAFCEASAWGVPSLCLRVGGVPVFDGENGHALPPGSGPADFAAVVRRYIADPAAYRALSHSARATFESRLNWTSWARHSVALLAEAVDRKRFAATADAGL